MLNSRILVTGGTGFLGSHIVEALRAAGAGDVEAVSSTDYDLTDIEEAEEMFDNIQPDVVIHAAANVGGIGYNARFGYNILTDNVRINTNVLHFSLMNEVDKFIGIGSVCAYPADTPVPFSEDALWSGYPEATNAPYGISKRLLLEACQAAHRDTGLNAIHLILANLYGPDDYYDERSSHVIPAMIRKIDEAQRNGSAVTLYGTGRPTRDFLYVEDAATTVVKALLVYDEPSPLNIGTGIETSIGDLAHTIASLMDYDGEIYWDSSKPDGQMRRALDATRALHALNWHASTTLVDGLRATIAQYRHLFGVA